VSAQASEGIGPSSHIAADDEREAARASLVSKHVCASGKKVEEGCECDRARKKERIAPRDTERERGAPLHLQRWAE
jgi:hypothetical protein